MVNSSSGWGFPPEKTKLSGAELANQVYEEQGPKGSDDCYIAVMGVTGAGKSSFISKCIDFDVGIGHGQCSETQEIRSFMFPYGHKMVHLIDTPGFDDTCRSDADVLKELAFWLNEVYRKKIQLSGIVYLHDISRNRMTGGAERNLLTFRQLCGSKALSSVVLGTTMWQYLPDAVVERNLHELKTTQDFWGSMMAQGSRVFQHEDTRASAMKIVSYILNKDRATVLQIQRQMVDQGCSLDKTSAGQELNKDILKQKAHFEKKLKETKESMMIAIQRADEVAATRAGQDQEEFEKKLDVALKEGPKLKISMESLMKEKELENKQIRRELEKNQQADLRRAKIEADKLDKLRAEMDMRAAEASENERKHVKEINALRQEYLAYERRSSAASVHSTSSREGKTKTGPSVREEVKRAGVAILGTAVAGATVAAPVAALGLCAVM